MRWCLTAGHCETCKLLQCSKHLCHCRAQAPTLKCTSPEFWSLTTMFIGTDPSGFTLTSSAAPLMLSAKTLIVISLDSN